MDKERACYAIMGKKAGGQGMRLENMLFRTQRGDNTLEQDTPENLMVRGGFITTEKEGKYYTELGVLLKERLRKHLERHLEGAFHKVDVPGHLTTAQGLKAMADLASLMVRSYRDLPCAPMMWKELHYGMGETGGLWRRNVSETLLLSRVGEGRQLKAVLEGILESLEIPFAEAQGNYYFLQKDGLDRMEPGGAPTPPPEGRAARPVDSMEPVQTPGVRTVADVMTFFSCEKEDVLKTMLYQGEDGVVAVVLPGHQEVDLEKVKRHLDIYSEDFRGMTPAAIRTAAHSVQGSVGPVGVKNWQILVDRSVLSGKSYIAGGNVDGVHLRHVVYGRDFIGQRGDFAKTGGRIPGYHLGGCRTRTQHIRYRDVADAWAFEPVELAFLNMDRLLLATVHARTMKTGIVLPRHLRPFDVVVTTIDPSRPGALQRLETVYALLREHGVAVLADGRKDRIGSKFHDYDRMSVEQRIIIGKPLGERVEVKHRDGKVEEVLLSKLVEFLEGTV